jgi:hypothetical protein
METISVKKSVHYLEENNGTCTRGLKVKFQFPQYQRCQSDACHCCSAFINQ